MTNVYEDFEKYIKAMLMQPNDLKLKFEEDGTIRITQAPEWLNKKRKRFINAKDLIHTFFAEKAKLYCYKIDHGRAIQSIKAYKATGKLFTAKQWAIRFRIENADEPWIDAFKTPTFYCMVFNEANRWIIKEQHTRQSLILAKKIRTRPSILPRNPSQEKSK